LRADLRARGGQVHRFSLNGVSLAYDVGSGSLMVLDPRADRALERLPADPAPEMGAGAGCDEAEAELRDLIEGGLLLAPPPPPVSRPSGPALKALCLSIAHDCELACRYCFAGQGRPDGNRALMPPAVAVAAIDLLHEQAASRNVEVDFFGGEPLLNLEAVKAAVHRARHLEQGSDRVFRFTLTTNALRLDAETEQWLRSQEVQLILSLDGRPEVHDRLRPRRSGGGSYRQAAGNISRFCRRGGDYYVRGTFTRYNLDFSQDVLHLLSLGARNISLEPVTPCGALRDHDLTLDDLDAVAGEYRRLARVYLDREAAGDPFRFFHFELDLDRAVCLPRCVRGCGAGCEYLAVSPDGRLYPCHQFTGHPEFVMGTVHEGVTDEGTRRAFARTTIHSKEPCRDCWARYLCSGGCHARAWNAFGSLERAPRLECRLQQSRLEAALYVQAGRRGSRTGEARSGDVPSMGG